MKTCLLLIDDDANLLSAMRRQFRHKLDIHTAQGGEEALARVRAKKLHPAVVICDMRMAGMDGVKTLAAMRQAAPDATRVMLTGNADLKTAIDAINAGYIFRFLTKPCPADTLAAAIDAALEQHRQVAAEREMLAKTLAAGVRVVTDVLAIAAPDAFFRAARVAFWAQDLVARGVVEGNWQLDLAALLAPIGLVFLPTDVLGKLKARAPLNDDEAALLRRAPDTARRIIGKIPRLHAVANIVYLQNRGFDGSGFPEDGPSGDAIPTEARLLHILNDLAADPPPDFARLDAQSQRYDPDLYDRVRRALG